MNAGNPVRLYTYTDTRSWQERVNPGVGSNRVVPSFLLLTCYRYTGAWLSPPTVMYEIIDNWHVRNPPRSHGLIQTYNAKQSRGGYED